MADSNLGWDMFAPSAQAAAPTPSTGGDSGDFSFGNLSDALTKQSSLITTQQAQDKAALIRSTALTAAARAQGATISDQSMQSAASTRKTQLTVLSGIDQQITKAQTAMKLSDSTNPLDHLQLWALQQSDPTGYTRNGNLQRMQYLTAASESLGTEEAVKQAGYQDSLTSIKNHLDLALSGDKDQQALTALAVAQGQQRIDVAKEDIATKSGFLQTQNTMQDASLANLTSDQVALALKQATASPNGTVNVGGVDLSVAKLQERQTVLDNRNYDSIVMRNAQGNLALTDLQMPQAKAALATAQASGGMTMLGGVPMSAARIQSRIDQLNGQAATDVGNQFQMDQESKTLLEQAQKRLIGGMNQTEITATIANGGLDKVSGIQYDLGELRNQLTIRQQTAAEQAQQDATVSNAKNPLSGAVAVSNYIDQVKADPGSQLFRQLQVVKQAVNASTWVMSMNQDPQHVALAAGVVANSYTNVNDAIDAEAKRQAGSDHDKELALQSTLRGQPIPPEVIQTAVTTRAAAGKPIGDWLSPNSRQLFTAVFQQTLNQLKVSNIGMDQKDLQAMAADTAFQQVKTAAAQPITDQILSAQVRDPTNPLFGVVDSGKMLTIIQQADQDGAKQYASENQLTDDQTSKLLTGTSVDPGFAAAQGAALYSRLNQIQPGLGKKYTDWWNSQSRNALVDRYMSGSVQSATDFTSSSERSLVAPDIKDAFAQYGNAMSGAEARVMGGDLARQHANYVQFGGDPTLNQVYLLQANPALNDSQRQQAYTGIIKPLLDQAKAENMNMEETKKFVEVQLQTMTPDNPNAKNLLKTMMAGREDSLKAGDDVSGLQLSPFTPYEGGIDMAATGYKWWQDLQK